MQQALSFRSSFLRVLRLVVVSITLAAAIVIALPAAPADAYTPPATIATDCSRDVAAELTNWIASVPNASTLSFATGGCYRIDGTVFVRSRDSLVFEGNGATFRAVVEAGNGRHHWYLDRGSNLTMRNMTIEGADPTPGTFEVAQEHQHGVNMWHTQGARLENLTIRNVHGDFVYVGHHNGTPARDVLVLGGHFSGAGRQGVAVTNGERITVDGTYLEKVGNSVFDLEPGSLDLIRDITVRNTTIGDHRHLFLPSNVVPATNVLIANNRILGAVGDRWPDGPGSAWPTVDAASGGSGWVIRNNDFARFENAALRFSGVYGVTVACNRIRWVYGTGVGLSLNGGATVRVTDNRFVGASGVYSGSASDILTTGNLLTDSALPDTCGAIGPQSGASPSPSPSSTQTATPTPAPTPTVTPTPIDNTPPTAPPGLTAGWVKRALHLSWQAASDNVGVAGYRIYRNGALVGTTTSLGFVERTSWKKSSTYSVRAYDTRGNLSDAAIVSVSSLAAQEVEQRPAKRTRPSR
jgi:hypothetical protein